jgi:hypothetical protein
VTLEAKGTTFLAGLILVSVLTGMGYYGPAKREKPCGCKDKSCTISEPARMQLL